MTTSPVSDGMYERAMTYPDSDARERLGRLVGLDDQKDRLTKILALFVNPAGLEAWAAKHHPGAADVIHSVMRRPPLVVLVGDVGSGKTELAETIGDSVARQEKIYVTLLPLSLASRGQGRVGEMTQLVSAAFEAAVTAGSKLKSSTGKSRGAVIMLVDEADALAQSREETQMHNEDRAGVIAFIRGIDRITNARLPVAVIMCTNRLGSLDPAVRRRAAEILSFSRPDDEQRRHVLTNQLGNLGIAGKQLTDLVAATGPSSADGYGSTFSDLTQRLVPSIMLDAYPHRAVEGAQALRIARAMKPTPPFRDTAR